MWKLCPQSDRPSQHNILFGNILSGWGCSEGHYSTGKPQVFNKDVEYGIKLGRVLGFSDVFGYSLVHKNWKFVFELFAEITQGF